MCLTVSDRHRPLVDEDPIFMEIRFFGNEKWPKHHTGSVPLRSFVVVLLVADASAILGRSSPTRYRITPWVEAEH